MWVLSGSSLLKGSGKKRLVGQMLAASGPVLLGLLSGEELDSGLSSWNFSRFLREMQLGVSFLRVLSQCGLKCIFRAGIARSHHKVSHSPYNRVLYP